MSDTPPMLFVEPLYEGSAIAQLAQHLQPLVEGVPLHVGAGEASRNAAPPRVVIVGPLGATYSDVAHEQPTDGYAQTQKIKEYEIEIWGTSLAHAECIEDTVVDSLASLLGLHWQLEIVRSKDDGGRQGERSWVITLQVRITLPVYTVQYRKARLTGALHGVLVGQLVPPDPNAEPIPGMA